MVWLLCTADDLASSMGCRQSDRSEALDSVPGTLQEMFQREEPPAAYDAFMYKYLK